MAIDIRVKAYFLGNTSSNGGKDESQAFATTIVLTDDDEDGFIRQSDVDLLDGEIVKTLKDESTLKIVETGETDVTTVQGWYLEVETPDGQDIYFVPTDGTIPADGELAADVVTDGEQDGHTSDLTPIPTSDGIVSGTSGDDLIDINYVGDPDNPPDRIDNGDNIFPELDPDSDIVDAGHGDDTILSGNDADIVFAGEGADSVDAGTGNDEVFGDEGQDTLRGEEGDDILVGGEDSDQLFGDAGNDFLSGGAGEDTLDGGIENDTLVGGEGGDALDGFSGNDVLLGEGDNDTILGGAGKDTIFGGSGADNIDGGFDNDLISGGSGNDTVDGFDGDDSIKGGDGADSLGGGDGADVIRGGAGNDVLQGAGFIFAPAPEDDGAADQLFGGDDEDIFINVGAGDTVVGGEGGVDNDTLDLSNSDQPRRIIYTDTDGNIVTGPTEQGRVEFLDAPNGSVIGITTFSEIEQVICFTNETKIATEYGEVSAGQLSVGDRVITRDNGYREIAWIGRKRLSSEKVAARRDLAPVVIKKGALGAGLPENDLMVSPNHRVLVRDPRTSTFFGETEVLVAARHLVNGTSIVRRRQGPVTYVHILCEHHEIVMSDGAWTESFLPGEWSLDSLEREQHEEVLGLFPELRSRAGLDNYVSARQLLKKHEAKLLLS